MAKIINPSRRPLTLATLHVVPREGELVTTNAVILHTDNWTRLNAMSIAGEITIVLDSDQAAATPVYATDAMPLPAEVAAPMVYATDAPPPAPEEAAAVVYATDPVQPPVEPIATPVYATDAPPTAPIEVAAEPTTEPTEAISAPVETTANAAPAKASK